MRYPRQPKVLRNYPSIRRTYDLHIGGSISRDHENIDILEIVVICLVFPYVYFWLSREIIKRRKIEMRAPRVCSFTSGWYDYALSFKSYLFGQPIYIYYYILLKVDDSN